MEGCHLKYVILQQDYGVFVVCGDEGDKAWIEWFAGSRDASSYRSLGKPSEISQRVNAYPDYYCFARGVLFPGCDDDLPAIADNVLNDLVEDLVKAGEAVKVVRIQV